MQHKLFRLFASLILVLVMFFTQTTLAVASALAVDSTTDAVDANPGDGICASAIGECTLRAAFQEANALPGDDTITLPPGTYTLTIAGENEDASATGDLDITSNLTINGVDAASTIINGNGSVVNDRVFQVTGDVMVGFSRITITGGNGNASLAAGDGIFNAGGTVTITDSTISGNVGPGASGILNVGTMTLNNSLVSGNSTSSDGGGIHNRGSLDLINSTVSDNVASGGLGGGIFNENTLILNNTNVSNNTASGVGGGIWNAGGMTLSGSTINGNMASSGAGIFNIGTANLSNNTISGNTSTSLGGGGIQNINGILTVTDSTFSANSANQSGGSIRNFGGGVTIINSTFSDNSAGSGGGITNEGNGTLTVTDSTFSANSADQGGGGIETNGTLAVTNSTLSANSADQGGGIISYGGTVTVTNSTVSSNTASSYGGGIFNTAGTVTLTDSSVNGNTASSFGGGIYNDGTVTLANSSVSSNIASAGGGGILNNAPGTMTLTNSLVNGNTAAGGASGIYNGGGTLTMINSTVSNNLGSFGGGGLNNSNNGTATLIGTAFSGNTATNSGGGAIEANSGTLTVTNSTFSGNSAALGGALHVTSGSVSLNNVTISNNTATNQGGGIFVYEGFGAAVNAKNTILAGNLGPASSPDCNGALSSEGYNLVQDTTGCSITGDSTGNQIGVDPLLGPLQDNGGPTETHALLPGSPAIDAGNPAGCTDQNSSLLNTDQRGVARVGICDIGAYEVPTAGLLLTGGNNQIAVTTFAFPQPLQATVFDNQGSPASGVTVTFTAPANGPSGTFVDSGTNTIAVVTDESGVATTSPFIANDQAGAYTVSASANGLGSVYFSLEQVSRPGNDNFADAEPIGSLPFTATVDITNATNEQPIEPQYCYFMPNTVWYSFTPTVTTLVRADTQGSAISNNLNVYSTGNLNILGCTVYNGPITFLAEAGQTYYFQLGALNGELGAVQINLTELLRPNNDDLAHATVISTFPFTDTVENANATVEAGEPLYWCYTIEKTLWYSFTPTETVPVRLTTQGSTAASSVNVYRSTGGGFPDLSFITCTGSYSDSFNFLAEAGVTYYFQASLFPGQVGSIQLNLEQLPLPANDNFANATPVNLLPSTIDFDNTWATFQSGEPSPSCAYPAPPYKTVWFAYTALQGGTVSASVPNSNFSPFMAVYSGAALNNLTQLSCSQYSNKATFHVTSGQTYYIQIGGFYGGGGTGQFLLETAPPPQASFYYYPGDPSRFDTIQFQDNSYDPGNVGIQTYSWSFGDGTSASGYSATHKYAADGNYQVTHTVTTIDGRTASTVQTVQVRTHDVAITKITTPASANVGQTKTITVTLRNIAYSETVQIDLYKSTPNGFVWIGTVTTSIPALAGNRTTAVNFTYKFTSDDAKLGKVTFKAVATIIGARDSYPADNEKISLITKVAK